VDDTLRSLGFGLLIVPAVFGSKEVLQAQSLGVTPVPCKGQIISRIDVSARPPFEVKGSGFQRQIARKLGDLHATTNPNVVSRFLALRTGMACSELRRLESERILRAQPYLSDATITVYPDDAGGVYLSVVTVDEISLVLGGGGSSATPYVKSFKFGEENSLVRLLRSSDNGTTVRISATISRRRSSTTSSSGARTSSSSMARETNWEETGE
jgi:hypothetical protein